MPARHHDIPNTPVQRPDSHDKNGPAVSSRLETAANTTDPATPAIPAAMILTEPAYRRTTVMPHPKQKPLCQSGNRIPPDKKEMTGRFRKTSSNETPNTSTGPGHPPYRRKSGKSPSKALQYTFPTIKKNAPVQPDRPVIPSERRPLLRPSASPPMHGTDVFSTRQGKTLLDTSPVLQNTFTVYNRFPTRYFDESFPHFTVPVHGTKIRRKKRLAAGTVARRSGRRHAPPVRHLRRGGNGTAHPCGHRARRFSSSMVIS